MTCNLDGCDCGTFAEHRFGDVDGAHVINGVWYDKYGIRLN